MSGEDKTFGSVARFLWTQDWLGGDDKTIGTTARYDDAWDNIPSWQKEIEVTAVYGGMGPDRIYGYATGGSYYGGSWHEIPQAASGGKFHGTLFWAGEQGAEVVGHAGGRTEVLNRSQLASTMYVAVSNAMSGLRFNVESMSASNPSTDGGYDEDALYRAMLRALLQSFWKFVLLSSSKYIGNSSRFNVAS